MIYVIDLLNINNKLWGWITNLENSFNIVEFRIR